MKKLIGLAVVFFLGYGTHYLVVKYRVYSVDPATYLDTARSVPQEGSNGSFVSYINFDGEDFKPTRVLMKKGNYLAITNESSEKQMWLISKNSDLVTPRGYALGERLQVMLTEPGEYLVANKEKLSSVLTVIVE